MPALETWQKGVEMASSETDAVSEVLQIIIKDPHQGDGIHFKIKKKTKMLKVFEAWAAKKNVNREAWRFITDSGERIGDDATPKLLGLEDGDTIDAMTEQTGGVTGSGSRARMPHNNRVSSSASLKTNDMWSKTIGYDPYAAEGGGDDGGDAAQQAESMERAKGIMALAKISSAEQGNSDRSTNFAKQVFWGLKRKAPPKGYEVAALSDIDSEDDEDSSSSSDSSSDSDDDDDDDDDDGGGSGRSGGGGHDRKGGGEGSKHDRQPEKRSSGRDEEERAAAEEEKRRRKKERKARKKAEKAERKKHKKEKKARKKAERKEKKRRRKEKKSEEAEEGSDGGEDRKKKKKKKKSSH